MLSSLMEQRSESLAELRLIYQGQLNGEVSNIQGPRSMNLPENVADFFISENLLY